MTAEIDWDSVPDVEPGPERDYFGVYRNGNNQPLIMAEDGSKRYPYQRTTNFIDQLEDGGEGLRIWTERLTLAGLVMSPELRKELMAWAGEPRELSDIARRAARLAGRDEKQEWGSMLHQITDAIDKGDMMPRQWWNENTKQLEPVPVAEVNRDVEAYRMATRCLTHHAAEQMHVFDPYRVAGTPDRVSSYSANGKRQGRPKIVDLKGLALDTKLPTPSGWTTMGAIRVGDQVIGSNGLPCNVVAKSGVKRIGTYVVTFDDGTKIACDSEHIWWTQTQPDRIKRRQATARTIGEIIDTLRYNGQAHHWVPVTAIELPEIELGVDPYLLGCWLGDGSRNRSTITKGRDLFDVLERDGHILGVEQADARRPHVITRTVAGLVSALREMGLLGNKHLPSAYLRASYGQRLRLLQGLMDTDGTWNTARRRACFTTTNKGLAYGVDELLRSLGQRPHLAEVQRSGFGVTATAYDVEFTPHGLMPFRLPRKIAKVQSQIAGKSTARASRHLIVSVEPGPDVETACIAVDSPNSTYLCSEAMIATHNTGTLHPRMVEAQLAMYSRSRPYDPQAEVRLDADPVDQKRGIVIHLPMKQARCELFWADLTKGWADCKVARDKHQKGLRRKLETLGRLIELGPDVPLMDRVGLCANVDALRDLWKEAVERGELTEDLKAACLERQQLLAPTSK